MAHPQQQFADIVQQTQRAFTKGAQSWAGGVQRLVESTFVVCEAVTT